MCFLINFAAKRYRARCGSCICQRLLDCLTQSDYKFIVVKRTKRTKRTTMCNTKPAGMTYKLITYFRFEHVLRVYFAMMYKDVDKTIQFRFAHIKVNMKWHRSPKSPTTLNTTKATATATTTPPPFPLLPAMTKSAPK